MLTERQRGVLEFIQSEQREKGVTPSTREIQHHFGFASQISPTNLLISLTRLKQSPEKKQRHLRFPFSRCEVIDFKFFGFRNLKFINDHASPNTMRIQ